MLASHLPCQPASGSSDTCQTNTHQPLRELIWTTELGRNSFLPKPTGHFCKSGLGNTQVPPPNILREAMADDLGSPQFNTEGTLISFLWTGPRSESTIYLYSQQCLAR